MPEENRDLPPLLKRDITIGHQTVALDTARLQFNDANIAQLQERVGLWYDYFGSQLADAEYEETEAEDQYDNVYNKYHIKWKEEGCTEKLAEAHAKNEPEVMAAKEEWNRAKLRLKRIQQHLKAWDKAHENAQNRGYTIRKEMDKLNSDIYYGKGDLDKKVNEIIRPKHE
jgi:hypothetical protein